VDQEILIPVELRQLRKGAFYEVEITGAEDYDLYGEVISSWRKKTQ
jgi:ribosomal protein S12 methylthiotransferase